MSKLNSCHDLETGDEVNIAAGVLCLLGIATMIVIITLRIAGVLS